MTNLPNNDFDGTAQFAREQARRQGGQAYGSSGTGYRRHNIVDTHAAESWRAVALMVAGIVAAVALCAVLL